MKKEDFDKLSKEQQELEKERCNSFEYFYNNYCKKEGMPDFSQTVWNEYLENAKKQRFSRRRMGGSYFYPFTPEEAFQVYKEAKELQIKKVANKWKNKIEEGVYQAMYDYKVEITD